MVENTTRHGGTGQVTAPARLPVTGAGRGARRGRLDVVLHAGSGKTGTSSIQRFLQQRRPALARAGWLYPTAPGANRHARLSLYLRSPESIVTAPGWRRQRSESPEEFYAGFREALRDEIEASDLDRVLLSDEGLYGAPLPGLARLGRISRGLTARLRVVIYLRRQDEHLISRYQQRVKMGETRTLAECAEQDLTGTYDYRARLESWQRLVQPTELVVRRFERRRFVGGSLVDDFLDASGISLPPAKVTDPGVVNESLDADAVELLRLLNLDLARNGGTLPPVPRRPLVKQLAALSTGPILTLPGPTLDRFMARWEEGNRAVAREWVGDETGELFDPPHGSRISTAHQGLNPSRLEELLGALEMPEEHHVALRQDARRTEARGGARTSPTDPRPPLS